jgi:hypothetical protein
VKPISEWTDEELRRMADPEDPMDPVAEILRLRREVEDYAGRSRDWAQAHRKALDEIQLAIQWHNDEARRAARAERVVRALRDWWPHPDRPMDRPVQVALTEYLEGR